MASPDEQIPSERDGTLLLAWKQRRDQESFRTLCLRHAGLVTSACHRLRSPDPDEAAQAVFILLARKPQSVGDPDRLAGWLLGAARRVVGHQRRAARRRRRYEEEAAMESERIRTSSPVDWSEARPLLDEALARLSPARREALLRFYLEGKPQAAVAAELGCSIDAVKTRIHEGLEHLRASFARRGVTLGIAALASGLASEATACEPASAAACAQAALSPSGPAAALAQGIQTAMLIKSATLVAGASLLAVTLVTSAFLLGAEPQSQPAAGVPAAHSATSEFARNPAANAALDWWRAFDALPQANDPIWQKAQAAQDGQPVALSDSELSLLRQPLSLLALGAANPYCTWGVDVGEGIGATLPHIQRFRQLIRLGLLRSQAHGPASAAAAVDDLLLCLRASRLAGGERPLLIERHVLTMCERMSLSLAAQLAPDLPTTERRRLEAAVSSLPPSPEMAVTLAEEMAMWTSELTRIRRMPLAERVKARGGETNWKVQVQLLEELSDDSLDRTLRQYPVVLARWTEHVRRPLAERVLPLKPVISNGDQAPVHIFDSMRPGYALAIISEVRLAVERQQLAAILAFLDRGEAALAAIPDALTGKPFRLVQEGEFRCLMTEIPGNTQPAKLWIGMRPAPSAPQVPAAEGQTEPAGKKEPARPTGF